MTLTTHYALAALTAYFTGRLIAGCRLRDDVAPRVWAAAFAAVALSAFCGGTYTGFGAQLDAALSQSLWRATLCFAGAASFLFLCAVAHIYAAGRLRLALVSIAAVKFTVLVLWIARQEDYRHVVYDAVATILPVLALSAWGAWSRRDASAGWILAGILVSLVGALMQQGRVALHPQFSENNLFHLLQMVAMYLFYRAGQEMRDGPVDALQPAPWSARGEP